MPAAQRWEAPDNFNHRVSFFHIAHRNTGKTEKSQTNCVSNTVASNCIMKLWIVIVICNMKIQFSIVKSLRWSILFSFSFVKELSKKFEAFLAKPHWEALVMMGRRPFWLLILKIECYVRNILKIERLLPFRKNRMAILFWSNHNLKSKNCFSVTFKFGLAFDVVGLCTFGFQKLSDFGLPIKLVTNYALFLGVFAKHFSTKT